MSETDMNFLLSLWSELEADTLELRADNIMKDLHYIYGRIDDNDDNSDVHQHFIENMLLQELHETDFQLSRVDTKVRCPKEGGCSINIVRSLGGRGLCKGVDAIGSMNAHTCQCGLHWKENNLRERIRRQRAGFTDTLCVIYMSAPIHK